MEDNQKNKIIKHGEKLIKIFNLKNEDPLKLCSWLRRKERQITVLTIMDCNGLGNWESNDREEERLFNEVKKRLNDLNNILYLNTDPRGYALKIKDSVVSELNLDIQRDWGGYGIIAPEITKEVQ